MFGPNHYVPILRGKKGEIQALAHLDKIIRKKLTPFIDVPPTNPINVEGKSLEKHLFKINKPMRLNWGLDLPFFIDLSYISSQKVRHKQHPLDYLLDEFRLTGLKAIPTSGLDRDEEYNYAVGKSNSIDKRGVCIRLIKDDIEFAEELNDKLNDLQGLMGIAPGQVHLLIDFRSFDEGVINDIVQLQ